MRDLHKASLEVSFVLCHLQDVATLWFRSDMKIRLTSIVGRISELETELARSQKWSSCKEVLQMPSSWITLPFMACFEFPSSLYHMLFFFFF